MRRAVRADVERFRQELDACRSTIADLSRGRQKTSLLDKQLTFWTESARFLISELEVWGKLGDDTKYDATYHKVQKNLDLVQELITNLIEEQDSDIDAYEE